MWQITKFSGAPCRFKEFFWYLVALLSISPQKKAFASNRCSMVAVEWRMNYYLGTVNKLLF